MKMKSANPKLLTGRHALMLAVTIQALVAVDRAEACTVGALPSSFASGATVDCSGDTKNSSPDPKIGYGTFNDNNNTYNINAGAKVTGDDTGVRFSTGAKFNISGTITGTNVDGITGHDGITGDAGTAIMTNTSTGIISGHNGIAVGTLDLHNAGQIRGLSSDGRAINAGSAGMSVAWQRGRADQRGGGDEDGGGSGNAMLHRRHGILPYFSLRVFSAWRAVNSGEAWESIGRCSGVPRMLRSA